jgi:general secretion pathway protein D
MIRAVVSSLGLILLFNSAVALAQTPLSAIEVAEEEAVKRQAAIRLLGMRLAEAQSLQAQGRIIEAAKVYEDGWALFPQVGLAGGNVEEQKAALVAGLVDVRLRLAEEARKRGDLMQADAQVKSALRVNPQSAGALKMKLELDKAIAASRGNVPSPETLARIPEVQTEKIQAGTLAHDGKLLFEMGHLDEAEQKFKQSVALDPENKAADYYLKLIRDQRFSREISNRELITRDAIVEVEQAWNLSIKRDSLPFPNPVAKTNEVHTSPQRQEIARKLNQIYLNEVGYEELLLTEVLRDLTDKSILRDPDGVGLNFIINPHSVAPPPAAPADPNAPPVIVEQDISAIDMSAVTVKLHPPIRNLRLIDVLDAIMTTASQPIRYEFRDYGIVFSARNVTEQEPLFTRTYKVDPNTFVQGLESVTAMDLGDVIGSGGGGGGGRGGGGGGQQTEGLFNVPRVTLAQISRGGVGGGGQNEGVGLNFVSKTNALRTINDLVRDYFQTAGVDLAPPKSVFFNDRNGNMTVRATLSDLEIIETAVQTLNTPPPQVSIEAKFAEIGQEDSRALGFDWFLGNTLMAGGRIGGQGGSAPSFSGAPTTANPSGIFPGPGFGPGVPGPGTIFPSATDGLVSQGIRNVYGANNASIPELGTITGILTDPQFRFVIRALEQRGGSDVLSAPKVTTLSGRQAQISILDLRTIVTGVDLENNVQSQAQPGGNNVIQNTQPAFDVFTAPIPFGPVLDVIPYVSADGYSIQMTLIPTLTEFLGYEDPGDFAPVASTGPNTSLTATLPLPRMRIRQVTTSCIVYDGQTIVLGGLISENLRKVKDKVPMLGDIPYVGRLFRSESQTSDKRNLVIFVSPTIIDPAGNRVHTDEELPFARGAIPPQAAVTAQ